MTKKVLFLINSLAGGGAERVMTTLLRHSESRRKDYDISLALLDTEARAYPPPAWLKVHELDCGGGLGKSISAVRKLAHRERPDVTLSFLTRANVANARAGHRRWGGRCLISERVHTTEHLGRGAAGRFARLLVRLTYPGTAGVIAVSQGVADDLEDHYGVRKDRLTVIHNPFDLAVIRAAAEQPSEIAPPAPFMAAVGRLVENKNFEMLIDAYAASGVRQRLVIAGEGPCRRALEEQIAGHGLQDRISLPGFVSNPYSLLRRADAFVLSSNAEGFPNGLVEAMALGLPVVATDCPSGPREILADGRPATGAPVEHAAHGLLVPVNDVAAMAEALKAISQAGIARDYAVKSVRRAEDFDVEIAVTQYWRLIDDALAQTTTRG